MQQRRPHSSVAIEHGGENGGSSTSREARRLERRMAKERRTGGGSGAGGGIKKLRRVKRSTVKYRKSSWGKLWNNEPYVQVAMFSFVMFALAGLSCSKCYIMAVIIMNFTRHGVQQQNHRPNQPNTIVTMPEEAY